jgi:hypothetical protein
LKLVVNYSNYNYNTVVHVPYVTSESEARDDDDLAGSEYAAENKSVFKILLKESSNCADLQFNVKEFQTIGALTLKAFLVQAGITRGTHNKDTSDERKYLLGL